MHMYTQVGQLPSNQQLNKIVIVQMGVGGGHLPLFTLNRIKGHANVAYSN